MMVMSPDSGPPNSGAAGSDSSGRAPTRSRKRATPTPEPQATPALAPSQPSSVFTTGWHDIDEAAYHADPCPLPSLSSSIARQVIGKSLMHAWRAHPRSPLFEPTVVGASADRGSAAHMALFGGRAIETIEADDWRTAAAREARDIARARGRIPMLAKEMAGLAAMLEPARERFHDLHGGTYHCEQSAIWRRGSTGWRRARIDTLSPSRCLIVDYKTIEGAVDAHARERRIADMALQIQAAVYVEAVEALHPELEGRVRFVFQWQEQKASYALSPPIEMTEAFMALGRAQWRAAGLLWDKALRHGAFPGYSQQPFHACPTAWELSRWEERAMLEALPSGGAQ